MVAKIEENLGLMVWNFNKFAKLMEKGGCRSNGRFQIMNLIEATLNTQGKIHLRALRRKIFSVMNVGAMDTFEMNVPLRRGES